MLASNLALAVDWSQTRYIAANSDNYHEHNIILGKYPPVERVDVYFATAIILNTALYWLLPEGWKKYWYTGLTLFEAGVVYRNKKRGVGFNWR